HPALCDEVSTWGIEEVDQQVPAVPGAFGGVLNRWRNDDEAGTASGKMDVLAPLVGILSPGRAQVMDEVAFEREAALREIGMRMRRELPPVARTLIAHPVDAHRVGLQHL